MDINIAFILLGWLLGMLSHGIVSSIDANRKRKRYKPAITADLKSLDVFMAANRFLLRRRYGELNHDFLNGIREICENSDDKSNEEILKSIDTFLKLSTEQLSACFKTKKNDKSMTLRKRSLQFIDSIISELSLFPIKYQRDVLDIRAQVNMYNELVGELAVFLKQTFDTECMKTNAEVLDENIKNTYLAIERRCGCINEKITALLYA